MLRNGAKFLQRRLYSYISTWTGFTVFLILCYFLVATLIDSLSNSCSLRGLHSHCSLRHSDDNIAFKNLEGELSYQPFDVVYTWVNGSDPRWLAKKEKWSNLKSVKNGEIDATSNNTTLVSNHTLETNFLNANATVALNETAEEVEIDDTMSSNRYRDSEELRFSLRSLVKNAPWIRHIYIVTDNQVPYWLNLESTRLTVIPHEDIFLNKSHLPVFSSPAIEANLHRIPGLSKKFIYFNDDVFLGARTLPEDFISMRGAQRLVMSWDVPKCAPGCSDTWIGDGFCDKACNVSACNFDFPDCVNGTNSNAHTTTTRASSSLAMCNKGCPDNWLADKICDQRCKNEECGWDVGDCGIDLVSLNYPGVAIDASNARILSTSSYANYNAEYGSGVGAYGHYGDPSGYFNEQEHLSLDQIRSEFESEISNSTLAGLSSPVVSAELENSLIPSENPPANVTESSGAIPAADVSAAAPAVHAYSTHHHGHRHPHNQHNQHNKMYPALTVEYGTPAVYFDLAHLACQYSPNVTCTPEQITPSEVLYERAEHDDEEGMVVHTTTLLTRHHLLVVLLYHGQDGVLPFLAASQDVKISVTVTGVLTSESTTATFTLRVMAQGSTGVTYPQELVPVGMALMTNKSYVGACKDVKQSKEERERLSVVLNDLTLLSHPYRIEKSTIVSTGSGDGGTSGAGTSDGSGSGTGGSATSGSDTSTSATSSSAGTVEEGVVLSAKVSIQGAADLAHTDCAQLAVSYELTDVLNNKHGLVLPLCDAVLLFSASYTDCGEFVPYVHNSTATSTNIARSVQMLLSVAERGSDALTQYVRSKAPPRSPRFLPQPESIPDSGTTAGTTSTTTTTTAATADNTTSATATATADDATTNLLTSTTQEVKSYLVHLRVPLPHSWASTTSQWYHLHAQIVHMSHIAAHGVANSAVYGQWADHSPDITGGKVVNCFIAAVKWGADRPAANTTVSTALNTTADTTATTPVTTTTTATTTATTTVNANEEVEPVSVGTHSTTDVPIARVTNVLELGNTEFATTATTETSSDTTTATTTIATTTTATDSNTDTTITATTAEPDHRRLTTYGVSLLASLRTTISHLASIFVAQVAWLSPSTTATSAPARRLEDTYGQSLVHVNRLYTKAFGTEGRKVPAHVPHMIDKDYMEEMQARWPEQWNATSAHRFRSPTDMQYSFSYYYYLSNRIKVKPHDLAAHVRKVLDTDGDGLLNENEFRSLAAMVKGSNSPSPQYIEDMYECIANNSAFRRHHVEEVVHKTKRGKVSKSFHIQPHPTIAEALNCTDIIETGLQQKVNWANLYPSHVHESDKDLVAFEMIGDNYTISMSQLDSVRQRQSKFVCINDNMKNPSKELEQALRSFYLSFFPEPCVFELPPGQRNPTLYLDEYQEMMRQKGVFSRRAASIVFTFPAAVSRWVWRSLQAVLLPVARHAAAFLSDEGNTDTTAQLHTELYVNGLRQDIARHPHYNRAAVEKGDGEWDAYSRNVLLFSVVGIVGFVILRQLSKANRAI